MSDRTLYLVVFSLFSLVIGFFIGGIVKKRKLIGNQDEDITLFRKELTGFPNAAGGGDAFRSVTPGMKEEVKICKCN